MQQTAIRQQVSEKRKEGTLTTQPEQQAPAKKKRRSVRLITIDTLLFSNLKKVTPPFLVLVGRLISNRVLSFLSVS